MDKGEDDLRTNLETFQALPTILHDPSSTFNLKYSMEIKGKISYFCMG